MPTVRKIEGNALPVMARTKKKIKVAAYARVSTDHEEQDGSFETQVEYYTNKIKNEPEWELTRIYADKGASGTCVEGREEFQEMIKDAKDGKIDLILTKSISRFARNTVTTLETIRELKEKGVAVEFEKENLRTDTNQGELMLTILSALAEQESKSISENIQWGIKAKFKEGKDVHNFWRFLGYEKGWKIVEDEAETVRLIFEKYLMGMSMAEICKELEKEGRKRQDGGTKWHIGSISYILNNPAYTGDILLQKSITTNYIGRVRKKNEGEEPMYYVEGHHPAIVGKEKYERVQMEIKRRKGHTPADFSVSPFFGTVFTAPLTLTSSPSNPSNKKTTQDKNQTATQDKNQTTPSPATTDGKKQENQSTTLPSNGPGLKNEEGGNVDGNDDVGVSSDGKEERKIYRRVTIHSNVESWKKVVWKPQASKKKKEEATKDKDPETTKPKIQYPTISEDELYKIFEMAIKKLREKEVREKIRNDEKEAQEKIPEIEKERTTRLAELKKKLNALAVETDEEKYEEMVREYNQKRSEYESLGDGQFALEQKLKEGKRIIENWTKIETTRDGEKEKLSDLYRALGVKMEVSMKDVRVNFGAGIEEKVEIEKVDKSWKARQA